MPELPEAERARQTLASVLGRPIAAVDDSDTYVCRPHPPGEIASALVGHTFASAHRRGKFLWLETEDGPTLGLHLGMAGAIVLEADPQRPIWNRFTVEFEDGTCFVLRDRRRLGRAVLNPDFGHVGPDAAVVGRAEFRRLVGAGRTAVKARLLNQGSISGDRQPARRPGAVAGAARAAAVDVRALDRGPRPPAPRAARGRPLGDPPRWRAHGELRRGARPRRNVSALWP